MSDLCPPEDFLRTYRQRAASIRSTPSAGAGAAAERELPSYLREIGRHVGVCLRCQHRILEFMQADARTEVRQGLSDASLWQDDPDQAWAIVLDPTRPSWVREFAIDRLTDLDAFQLVPALKRFARDPRHEADLRDLATRAAADLAPLCPGLTAQLRALVQERIGALKRASDHGDRGAEPPGSGVTATSETYVKAPWTSLTAPRNRPAWAIPAAAKLLIALVVLALLAAGAVWRLERPTAVRNNMKANSIEVASPVASARVSVHDTVRFVAPQGTPPNAVFVAYVHPPHLDDASWWATPCDPDPEAGPGHFESQVTFGLPRDTGVQFTVQVYLIDRTDYPRIGAPGSLPARYLAASAPIIVVRN